MQKVFNITNKYIVLATPLILFSLLSTIYLAVSARGALINILIALVLFALMTGAFIAGWFNMIKKAILEPDKEDPNSLMKEFPSGVGEYFLPALGSLIIMMIFSILLIGLSYFVGMQFIGDPGISADAFSKAATSPEALKAFIASLSTEQLLKINEWNLLLLGTMALTYFLMMLYIPAIFFKNKNPFIAFFISLKDIFGKCFLKTLGIYLLIFITYFVISILAALFVGITAVHFLVTLLNFYFVTFAAVGVFYYYYHSFVKPKIGCNIDTKI